MPGKRLPPSFGMLSNMDPKILNGIAKFYIEILSGSNSARRDSAVEPNRVVPVVNYPESAPSQPSRQA